jgi:class 3 adenylate cyclase
VATADDQEAAGLEWVGIDVAASENAQTLRLVRYLLAQGAGRDEIVDAAQTGSLGPLALDLALRSPGEMVPFEQAAQTAGLELEAAGRIWRALGFPDPLSSPTMLRPPQVRTLAVLGEMGRSELGVETVLRLARVIGGAVALVAEAVVDAFRVRVEMPRQAAGEAHADVVEDYARAAPLLLDALSQALDDILRGHVVAVARSTWAPDESQAIVTRDLSIGFVDLVGYTRSARILSPAELAEAVAQFEARVGEVVNLCGGRVVKLIGDEAMFVVDGPSKARELAVELVRALGAEPHLPQVRIGMAAGPVVAHHGDYYGDVVNLAARLVKAAEPGEILVSESLAGSDDLGAKSLEPVETAALKGYEDGVVAFRLTSA